MDATTFDPDRTIEIAGEKFFFRPLVYRQYKRFLSSIPKLGEDLSKDYPDAEFSIDDLTDERRMLGVLMQVGPVLMDRLLEWFTKSIVRESGEEVEKEFLEDNLGMSGFAKMAQLFIEVNDLKGVFENFRQIGLVMGMKNPPRPISS